MHPLWLTFEDGRLEERYRERRGRCLAERMSPLVGVHLGVLALVVAREWWGKGGDGAGASTAGMLLCHGVASAGIFLYGRWLGPQLRTFVVCRLLRAIEVAYFVHAWLPALLEAPASLFRAPLFKNMIFSLVTDYVIFPLPFKYQFYTNAVGTAAVFASLLQTNYCCTSSVRHSDCNHFLSAMSKTLTGLSNIILRGLHYTFRSSSMLPREPARMVIAFFYLSWIICVPTYLMWFVDHKARQNFLSFLSKEETFGESIEPMSARKVLVHISSGIVLFALLWRILIDI